MAHSKEALFLQTFTHRLRKCKVRRSKVSKFSADIARYKVKGNHGKDLWLNPLIWVIAFYRLRNWVNTAKPAWAIRIPVVLICFWMNKLFQIFMAMDISA